MAWSINPSTQPRFGASVGVASMTNGQLQTYLSDASLDATNMGGAGGANGLLARLKAQFMKFGCWECHGTAGQGTIAGPKLAPDPLPFDTLANFVRTTSRLMPPYRETVLPNEDLADIYVYLQSIPPAQDYKSLPQLAQ